MKAFSELLGRLYFTSGNHAKAKIIQDYLAATPDPDRGWALAAIAGELQFDLFKRKLIKELIVARVDPYLFDLSYDYVGELSETVAHLWPSADKVVKKPLPGLADLVDSFSSANKQDIAALLSTLLDNMNAPERWALLKLGTRGLRVGVSARFLKKILADYGNKDIAAVEKIWHGIEPPYTDLLHWLENKKEQPDFSDKAVFYPVMLAHPIDSANVESIHPDDWLAEWKYDGIRVQLVSHHDATVLFSRSGDDISHSFPDIVHCCPFKAVLDGELLIKRDQQIAPFNDLQQRLNKKKPSKKHQQDYPAHIIFYDALKIETTDLSQQTLVERQAQLASLLQQNHDPRFSFSESLSFANLEALTALRKQADSRTGNHVIEGLMLKRKRSLYVPGRPKGQWYKWKRDPLVVDAVMMYAQRGHGKRSSFYSDYTFGLWQEDQILPIGKAYSGFTDAELKQLDRWVRENTIGRFGPVREVDKALVLEVAFDSVHPSSRHKSGVALRFPRIHRIRWDKPSSEADVLSTLKKYL
ncbi:MAG: cisplatin damage response ATP-dependent DNA ligase [Pseudomonadota bacterium]